MLKPLRSTLFLLLTCSLVYCDTCLKCKQNQVHGMRGADCYSLDLEKIPQCFRSDVEIVELSHNRIRSIRQGDLSRYTNLKILYLDDNMIMNVDETAFEPMTALEILDMSSNSLVKIPPIFFQLPSLYKLYFSHNQYTNIVKDIENLKPITSPLQYLELAFNNLTELPNLGMLPTLFYFNITGNPSIKMTVSKFSGICNLKFLYNNNTTSWFDDPCECWTLETWLENRGAKFLPFNCQVDIETCNTTISTNDTQIYEECQKSYAELVMQYKIRKIVLPVCVAVVVLLLIIILIIIIKRRRKPKRLQRKNLAANEEENTMVDR
ncbi:hypothetical protein AMK59_4321 [Oryctes borbonicus]|uniref:Uncharacterized protein n=1 Tax=Oryctes borbonicus TaxID=1629725 RepID=A0A0T6B7M6_9SCAR|nr:hypothetical protein AMK59_4321 [Oryctes borbonicus]